PVTEDEAPDYFNVIKHPMDFATVRQKLLDGHYREVDAFAADLMLVLSNCMTYNTPDTYYFQLAARVKRHVDRLMAAARAHI
ncbi:Bromodomain-containing protein, partial [Coemansia reversa NRRL 1564]